MDGKISKHISLKEATRSNTAQRLGIDNFPTNDVLIKTRFTKEKKKITKIRYVGSFISLKHMNNKTAAKVKAKPKY